MVARAIRSTCLVLILPCVWWHVSLKMRNGKETTPTFNSIASIAAVKPINFEPSTMCDLRFSRGIVLLLLSHEMIHFEKHTFNNDFIGTNRMVPILNEKNQRQQQHQSIPTNSMQIMMLMLIKCLFFSIQWILLDDWPNLNIIRAQ